MQFLEFVYHPVFWTEHIASASSSTARIHLLTYGATWVGTSSHWAEDGNKFSVQKVFCSGHQTLDRVEKPSQTNCNMSLSQPSNFDLCSPKFVNVYVYIILVAADKHIFIATTWKSEIQLNNIWKFRPYSQKTHISLTKTNWLIMFGNIIADDLRIMWWHILTVLAVCEIVKEKGYGKYIYHRGVNSTLSMNNKWQNTKYENSCFEKAQNVTNTDKSET